MTHWGRFNSRSTVVATVALLSACGRYEPTDKITTKTTFPNEIVTGTTVQPSPTTAVEGGAVKGIGRKTAGTAAAPTGCAAPQSSEGSSDGLTLSLTVSKGCVSRAEDLTFTFKVTNRNSAVVHYDKDQIRFFSLKPSDGETGRSWEDDDCHPSTATGQSPAGELAPGQSVTVTGFYPAPTWEKNRNSCRLDAGNYDVVAQFNVCGPASYAGGVCNLQSETQYFSTPLRVTVKA